MTPEINHEPIITHKSPGRKKWLASLLPLFLLLKAKALTLAGLLGLFVLVTIAAGVLYFVFQCIKAAGLINPSPSQTTNTSAHITINDYDTGIQVAGTIYPTVTLGTNRLRPDALTASSGFTLQYGLDISSNPWTAPSGANVPQNINQYASGYDVNGNFVLTTPTGTWTYQCISTDAASVIDFDGYATNGFQTITDSVGDIISYSPPPSPASTNTVVILRSTDLLTWTPLATNQAIPGSVNSFTDPSEPTNVAGVFYRLAYNPLWDTNQP